MVEYKDRLVQAMTAAEMKTADLADRLGLSYQAIKKVVDGNTKALTAENSARAAQLLNVSSDWLALGEGTMSRSHAVMPYSELSPAPIPGRPTVAVPVLSNSASMGSGAELLEHDVLSGDLKLSQDWVMQRVKPSSMQALRFIHGYGDSMKGTFNDGDILLVDTGIRLVDIDGVYVLCAHDRLFVKRVRQRWDGQFEISSDNPSIKTSDLLDGREQLDVRGRVLWAWNGQKL